MKKNLFAFLFVMTTNILNISAINQAAMVSNYFWNFSNPEFRNLGTITSTRTINGLTIYATATKTVVIDDNNPQEINGVTYTSRLKLGGTGNEEARMVSFHVEGECYIDIYLMSASGSEDRILNVDKNTFGHTLTTIDAWSDVATKSTYHYTGSSTTIYLYSPSSGVNLYGVQVRSAGEPIEPENARFWNFSKSPFSSLGVISTVRTLNGLTLLATQEKSMEVSQHDTGYEKEMDGYVFTHRLKLVGEGTNEGRTLTFDVAGFCDIDVYLLSSSDGVNRTLNVDCGSFGNHLNQVTAYGGTFKKQTINYRGGATKIFIYSADQGINIYAIRATALSTPSFPVIFMDYDGKILSEQTITYGGTAVEPNRPTRSGYDFVGWGTSFSNVTEKKYVIAQYAIKTSGNYTVTYMDGVDNTMIANESITLNIPAYQLHEGYTFTGWETVNSNISNGLIIRSIYTSEYQSNNIPEAQTPPSNKNIKDGQILILRGDKTYTLQGQEVK